MDSNAQYEVWSRMVDGSRLNSTERKTMEQALNENPDLVGELANDIAIHGLLKLVAESPKVVNQFVSECTRQFESNRAALDDAVLDIDTRRDSATSSIRKPKSGMRKKKRLLAKWVLGILATAALVLIACFVVVFRNGGLIDGGQRV